jgi:aminomuconate-semialdehyde/2-hydroxymuconate-6-semialdehyde dehydrogenase
MTTEVRAKTRHLDHFIGGEFVPSASGKTFDTTNPATGELIATVSLGTEDDINRAVDSAQRAFESGIWSNLSLKERCQILRRIGDLILSKKAELARAESMDTGKPISETLEGDIPRAALNFHFFANYAENIGEECFSPAHNEMHITAREPLGVCGLITPWNLPLYLSTWKIAPCLAMGNTCVLKPAEWTPYTAFLLAEIVLEAGLPKGVFNVVQGFGANGAGEALTRHPKVKSISFTGETSTGRAIMQAASATLKKVSFELGGKGASIIFADADLSEALPTSVRAAYRNQGEICLAGSRLFVQDSIYKQVVEQVLERVKKIRVGDPLKPETEMGALVSKEHLEKVESYIAQGKKEGKLLTGGNRVKGLECGNFLEPALFTDLSFDSKFCQEEIFGPALPIIPFKSADDVIAMTNSTPYGLSASVWSSNVETCHQVSRRLQTGLVWVNCWFARDLRTPFGGQKSSGIGREGGRYSLEFFSEAKTISYRYKAT